MSTNNTTAVNRLYTNDNGDLNTDHGIIAVGNITAPNLKSDNETRLVAVEAKFVNYALASALGDYVLTTTLTTSLTDYVLNSALTTTLSNYRLKSNLIFDGELTINNNSLGSDERCVTILDPNMVSGNNLEINIGRTKTTNGVCKIGYHYDSTSTNCAFEI
jgi:hypothetical protein